MICQKCKKQIDHKQGDMIVRIRMADLKPCPFCGHEITGEQPYWDDMDTCDDYWIIRCGYCGANVFSDDKLETIEAWNRRVNE